MSKRIYLSPPHMNRDSKELLLDSYDSNWIAPLGPHVDSFENEMSEYLDVNASCALSSGTAALHLALRILNIQKGDLVLCPTLTFAASANVIMYEGAIPLFLDVNGSVQFHFNYLASLNSNNSLSASYKFGISQDPIAFEAEL